MKGRVILITGGARSGKSAYALSLGEAKGRRRGFLATCLPLDEEMRIRVDRHRENRGSGWETYEEPVEIARRIREVGPLYEVLVVDCLTLWLSNLIQAFGWGSEGIERAIEDLEGVCRNPEGTLILVSNEVGLGIVPENPLARSFRDLAGQTNQRIARLADELYFMVSGVPLKVK